MAQEEKPVCEVFFVGVVMIMCHLIMSLVAQVNQPQGSSRESVGVCA